jgi:hypothetical protein
MICASITLPPPVKPRQSRQTNQKNTKYYTLHTTKNDAFTLRISEQSRTSIVGFKEWDDAIFIGKMLETYFINQREWPVTYEIGSLILPSSKDSHPDVLNHMYIQQWDFDDLKVTCTKNFLDMISVDDLIKKKSQGGYTFSGKSFRFEADWDFYRARLVELHELNSDFNDLIN